MTAGTARSDRPGRMLVFEYLYRDADNYKASGSVWLTGSLTYAERDELVGCLEDGEFFIAEQVGLPPLYEGLFQHGGPNECDHAWHQFIGFRDASEIPQDVRIWCGASVLLNEFRAARGRWQPWLSPNFEI
jgi:hypothetical protein